nr:MAG TPA: DNA polymerase V subunit UmuD [Caudoviricetes sp.]
MIRCHRFVVCKNGRRRTGERSIVRVLNDYQVSTVHPKRRILAMGFPSTASDYVETRISLDQQLINQQRLTSCRYHVHISGKGYSRGAACGRGITYCLR